MLQAQRAKNYIETQASVGITLHKTKLIFENAHPGDFSDELWLQSSDMY